MTSAIAQEAQSIVREAAGDAAGRTIKGQIRDAARALGYPEASWRVREAWYLGAGHWSAQALRDLQDRYLHWRERRDREAAAARATTAARRAAAEHSNLEAARVEIADLRNRLARLEATLLRD